MRGLRRGAYVLACICVSALLLALGGLLVVLVGVPLWSKDTPPAEPKPREPPPAAAAPEPEPGSEAGSEAERGSALPAAPRPPEVTGPTEFVRRLEAGTHLLELRDSDMDPEAAQHHYAVLRRLLLRADGEPEGGLSRRLLLLTEPRRDRGALALANAKGAVRVWTLEGDRYPEGEAERAEELLRQLARVSGVPLERGVDVLATPGMGRDVFPELGGPRWAAGLYLTADEFCVVRSTYESGFRAEVLEHEIVHAYCRQFAPRFLSSRFVSEGLAEYLRCWRPSDEGLRVPAAAFADNLARLRQWIEFFEDAGVSLRHIDPRRMVRLTPAEFYSLRFLSYLTAQATMAFLGGEVIEQAFAERTDRAIVAAVSSMSMGDFLSFVEQHGAGGRPDRAVVVDDLAPAGPSKSLTATLAGLGVRRAERLDDAPRLWKAADRFLQKSEPQLAAIVDRLLSSDQALLVVTDLSEAMDRTLHPIETPERLLRIRATTGRDFVDELFSALVERSNTPPVLVGLGDEPRWIDSVRVTDAYSTRRLARWLAADDYEQAGLVLCVASPMPGGESIPKLTARYARALRKAGVHPHAALVIDFATAQGDALALARALAAATGFTGAVGYWNVVKGAPRPETER